MTFYITFSPKHDSEAYSSGFNVHHQGYWTIETNSFSEAIQTARSTFGRFGFANILNDKQITKTAFEKGELGVMKMTG